MFKEMHTSNDQLLIYKALEAKLLNKEIVDFKFGKTQMFFLKD